MCHRRSPTASTNRENDRLPRFDSDPCIYAQNATSITKVSAFQQIVTNANSIDADIIVLTETWLEEERAADTFRISGYTCLRKDRVKRRGGGGGVCAFVKQELHATRINVNSTMQQTKDLWFAVTIVTGLAIHICACYHPP